MVLLVASTGLFACTEEHRELPPEPRHRPGSPAVALLGSCARLADDTVWCFHEGPSDELTGALTMSGNGPFTLFNGEESHATCFARDDHVLRCFGSAREGGLAGASAKDTCEFTPWLSFFTKEKYACAKTPVMAVGAPPVVEISSSCALATDGNVWCWGREGREGPLFPPTMLAGIDGRARTISAESDARRVCAIVDDGRVKCADGGKPGALATEAPGVEKIVSLDLGLGRGCFIDGAGVAHCYEDVVGGPVTGTTPLPTELRFSSISLSWLMGCAITLDRRLACFRAFGDADGEGLPPKTPTLVPDVDRAVEVSVSSNTVFVRRDDGSVLEGVWPDGPFVAVAP